MQSEKKIITVFGVTGKQGGAAACALLSDKSFKVRGLSRKKDESKLQHLQEKGVDVIKANVATGENLEQVFKNAYGAFVVTHSFDQEVEGKEFECGKNLVDKARQSGVKVLIWSTSVHAHKLSGGKYTVPQFTEKAKVEDYIRSLQKEHAFESVVFVAPSFYYQNFLEKLFAPKKDESGCYVYMMPQTNTLSACDIHDLGPIALEIFRNPQKYNNKTILLEGEKAPPQHFVDVFSKVTGQKACLKTISHEEFIKCPHLHHSKHIAEMFAFINEYSYFGQHKDENIIQARDIYPQLKSWEEYLKETNWKGTPLEA
jgi:uncharacterized protein YbjT (DUF2867 family)